MYSIIEVLLIQRGYNMSKTKTYIVYEITLRVERLFNIDINPTPIDKANMYTTIFGNRLTLHMDIDNSGINNKDLLKLLIEPIDDNFLHDIKMIVNNINRDIAFYSLDCRLNSTWYDTVPKSNKGEIGIDLKTIPVDDELSVEERERIQDDILSARGLIY